MRKTAILTTFFLLSAALLPAADSGSPYEDADGETVRPQPSNTSTYKVRVAVNYPGGVSPASPVEDEEEKDGELVGEGYSSGGPYPYEGDTPYSNRVRSETFKPEYGSDYDAEQREQERREQERREQEDRERAEKEQREREEQELAEQKRLDEERAEKERRDKEYADRLRADRFREEVTRNSARTYGDNAGTNSNTLVTIDEFPTDIFSSSSPSSSSPVPDEPPPPEKAEPKVLATLYGNPITEEDVAREMWLRRGRETFDWLVGRDILKRELDRLDLRVSESEVRESLDKHVEVLRKAYPKLRKKDDLTRAASGMTLEEYRERTVWSELALRKIMRASLETRDEDLRRYFAAVRSDFIRPERVRISQIFIPPQIDADADGIADGEAWLRAELQIQEAHSMLRRQEFADVAKLFGSGALTSRWVKRGDLLRELEGPAFSISEGSITTPIKTTMGWHMLMVEEKEERGEPTLDDVRGEVLARFEEERFVRLAGEFMARLKEKALSGGGLVMVDVPGVFAQ